MRGLLARLRSYAHELVRPARVDADMRDEMRFHIDMEAERLARVHGLDQREARRRAAVAFGGIEKYRGASRDALGFTWIRGLSLDLKLALRMLRKYPGLSVACGLALAIAIGVGAGWYDLTGDVLRPTLPLPGGDRLVEIEMRNAAASEDERRLLHDFLGWRRDARSVEELGAYRNLERNLVLSDGEPSDPVTVAEITASAFRLTRVAPLAGRPLLEADERPGAPPVVVIGYTVWQRRFGGRADAIGRTVQLGNGRATVVGVMPEGYTFPVNHRLWVPLKLRPAGYAPLEGVAIRVFGRLAPGVTQAEANAELTGLAERAAAASPETHAHLRPRSSVCFPPSRRPACTCRGS